VALKPAPLTGQELRFLRRYIGLTLDGAAAKLGVTRQGFIKMEKAGERPTRMNPASEKLFRMIALDAKGVKPDQFKRAFDRLFSARPSRKTAYEVDARPAMLGRRFMEKLLSA